MAWAVLGCKAIPFLWSNFLLELPFLVNQFPGEFEVTHGPATAHSTNTKIISISFRCCSPLFYVRWKMANTFKCLITFTLHLFFKLFLHMVNFPLVSEAVTQLQNQAFTCSSVIDKAFLNTWTTSGFSSLKLNLGFHILNQSICCTWNWKQ